MARNSGALKSPDQQVVTGWAIKAAREWAGWERAHLAEALNDRLDTSRFTSAVIGDMESGRTRVDTSVLSALHDLLGVSYDWLLHGLSSVEGAPVAASLRDSDSPGYPSRFIVQAVGSRPEVLTFPPRLRPSLTALGSPPVVRRHPGLHGAVGDERGTRLHHTPARSGLRRPHGLRILQVDTTAGPLVSAA